MSDNETPNTPSGERQGTRKGVLAAGACIVVVGAGYLALHALGGGSGAAAPAVAAPASPAVALKTPSPTTTTTTAPGGQATALYNIYTAKDPFQPTLTASKTPASSGGTTTTTTPGGGSAGSGNSPSPDLAGSTTTTTQPPSGGGAAGAGATSGSSAPSRGNQISVMSVYAYQGQTMASVSVDDTVYRVAVGDHFGGDYSVVSLSQATQCASLNNGRVTFQVCQGQQILK